MSNEDMRIALWQQWPGHKYEKYGIMSRMHTTTTVETFPVTDKGLAEAIEAADNPKAQVVILHERYYESATMLKAVNKLIKAGKGKRIFKPATTLGDMNNG